MAEDWTLVADIGGTNARFARAMGGQLSDKTIYPTDGGLRDALLDFLTKFDTKPVAATFGGAGPVQPETLYLTNSDEELDLSDVRKICDTRDVFFVNDFEAAAWSLATIDRADVKPLNGVQDIPDGHRLIIGPGTGLGVGALASAPGGYHAIPGEGGHVAIAPMSKDELPIFEALSKVWPESQFAEDSLMFEAEACLSGTGLPYLYRAVAVAGGQQPTATTSAEILTAAGEGTDPIAVHTAAFFKTHLARITGDLALFLGSKGGVYFVGGVLLKNQWLLDDQFVETVRQGGRFSKLRASYPLFLMDNNDFGLIGAANAAAARTA